MEVLTLLEADALADLLDGRVRHPHHIVVSLAVAASPIGEVLCRPNAGVNQTPVPVACATSAPPKNSPQIPPKKPDADRPRKRAPRFIYFGLLGCESRPAAVKGRGDWAQPYSRKHDHQDTDS